MSDPDNQFWAVALALVVVVVIGAIALINSGYTKATVSWQAAVRMCTESGGSVIPQGQSGWQLLCLQPRHTP